MQGVNIITYNVNGEPVKGYPGGGGPALAGRVHPIPREFFIFFIFQYPPMRLRYFLVTLTIKNIRNLLSFNILVTFVTFFENFFHLPARIGKTFEIK